MLKCLGGDLGFYCPERGKFVRNDNGNCAPLVIGGDLWGALCNTICGCGEGDSKTLLRLLKMFGTIDLCVFLGGRGVGLHAFS